MAATNPLSVRLDSKLRKRTEQYARQRKIGVTTALRMIVSEHFDYLDTAAEMDAVMRWQHDQAWGTYKRLKDSDLLSLDDLRTAVKRKKKR